MARTYAPIWEKIKTSKDHSCTVEVHEAFVARVRKAVIKEKSNDLGFKVMNDHDYCFLDISVEASRKLHHKKICFKLRQRIGIEGVKS